MPCNNECRLCPLKTVTASGLADIPSLPCLQGDPPKLTPNEEQIFRDHCTDPLARLCVEAGILSH